MYIHHLNSIQEQITSIFKFMYSIHSISRKSNFVYSIMFYQVDESCTFNFASYLKYNTSLPSFLFIIYFPWTIYLCNCKN